jgi:hypothetical protein
LSAEVALAQVLVGRECTGRKGDLRHIGDRITRVREARVLAQPRFGRDCVVVVAENSLDCFRCLGGPCSGLADNGGRYVRGIPKLLGFDPDAV